MSTPEGDYVGIARSGPTPRMTTDAAEKRLERLETMARYAEDSLSVEMILWDRMDALYHMLRAEISRGEEL
jgi:pyrroloquinoline quinone (PQQ) biosynthesis protein C